MEGIAIIFFECCKNAERQADSDNKRALVIRFTCFYEREGKRMRKRERKVLQMKGKGFEDEKRRKERQREREREREKKRSREKREIVRMRKKEIEGF